MRIDIVSHQKLSLQVVTPMHKCDVSRPIDHLIKKSFTERYQSSSPPSRERCAFRPARSSSAAVPPHSADKSIVRIPIRCDPSLPRPRTGRHPTRYLARARSHPQDTHYPRGRIGPLTVLPLQLLQYESVHGTHGPVLPRSGQYPLIRSVG